MNSLRLGLDSALRLPNNSNYPGMRVTSKTNLPRTPGHNQGNGVYTKSRTLPVIFLTDHDRKKWLIATEQIAFAIHHANGGPKIGFLRRIILGRLQPVNTNSNLFVSLL